MARGQGESHDRETQDTKEFVQEDLAKSYLAVGRYSEAVALREELLAHSLSSLGPGTIAAMDQLASACLAAGRLTEALQHWTAAPANNQADRIFDIKIVGWLVRLAYKTAKALLTEPVSSR